MRKFHKRIYILIGFMVFLAVLDASFSLLTMYAIDEVVTPKLADRLWIVGVGYLVLTLLLSGTVKLFIDYAGELELDLLYKMRKDCFEKLQRLSFSYYDENALGWLMARTTSDAQKVASTLAWGIVDFFWGASMMLFIVIIMFVVHWQLALVTLAVVPILAVVSLYFQKRMLSSYRDVRKINSKITGAFNDGIVGAQTSKTLVREEQNIDEFQAITNDMKVASVRAAHYQAVYLPMVIVLSTLGVCLALQFGAGFLVSGVISIGTLVLFIQYARQFFDPIREMARIYTEMISAQAAAERVIGLIHEEEKIKDHDHIVAKYGDIEDEDRSNWEQIQGSVEFEDIEFYYKETEPILKKFNLSVKEGESIALVGETGSGKSTIVNLACRFYEPISGSVKIDGVDYKERSQQWLHSQIGYVLQSPHLFSGTILDNIKYGRLDATLEEVKEVCRLVDAHSFIAELENGYDTEVGEGGSKLSTGEKQLISFARAILANPRIFFLDEATSSIDTETEKRIQHAIDVVLEGRTSFIIAHRLSTIRNVDRILVISQGEIVEQGSHDELMSAKGAYYGMYKKQYIEETEQEALSA